MSGMEYALGHRDCPENPRKQGYKDCPACKNRLQNRKRKCDCGHVFELKRQVKVPRGFSPADWTTLEKNDVVFVISIDSWENKDGDLTFLDQSGEYKVVRVDKNGVVLFGTSGYSFQDMVNVGLNAETGITRGAAKIFKKDKK